MQGLHVHVGSQILDVEPFAESVAPVARTRRVPDLRPRRRARLSLHLGRQPAADRRLPRRTDRCRARAPARGGPDHHRAGTEHGLRVRHHDLPGHHRQARQDHVRRRGRRHGRQPRGRPVRAAVRGRHRRAASTGRTSRHVTVVGRHCESGDVLVDGVDLSAPAVGDLLAVPATGAYCFTMSNNYNGNRRIPVVFARDGQAAPRRTTGDLGRPRRARRRLTGRDCLGLRRRSAPGCP